MESQTDSREKIDLDTILVEEIGQFGRFQFRTCLLAGLIGIFVAYSGTGYVFTTGRINSRCLIPECDMEEPEWSPGWLVNAIPTTGTNSTTLDQCRRFGNTTVLPQVVESDTCPSSLFDRNTLVYCEEHVYENQNTIVYEFDLTCYEWRRSLIGTIRSVGGTIALPIVGYISDRWGRRVALCITSFNTAWIGLIKYWMNTYIGFLMSEFMEGLLGSGNYTSAYILMMELLGPKYRVAAPAAIASFYNLGQILLGLTAWGLPYWRHLILVSYIPQLFTVFYYFLISESVRWYMSKGRFIDSEALLKKAAKINGKELSEKSLERLRLSAEEERTQNTLGKNTSSKEWLIVTVFKHRRVLFHCIVASVWWISSTLIWYGLIINSVHISGNSYVNFMAVAAVEIPGNWFAVFLLSKIGRKPALICGYWVCAACLIAFVFISEDLYALSLTVYLIAQFCVAGVFVTLYSYTAELFPTEQRQSLFSVTVMIGQVGTMIGPLTPALGAHWFEELPFVLFAGFALLAGALAFLTPETRNLKLSDTFEEANKIGRNDKLNEVNGD